MPTLGRPGLFLVAPLQTLSFLVTFNLPVDETSTEKKTQNYWNPVVNSNVNSLNRGHIIVKAGTYPNTLYRLLKFMESTDRKIWLVKQIGELHVGLDGSVRCCILTVKEETTFGPRLWEGSFKYKQGLEQWLHSFRTQKECTADPQSRTL